MKHPRIIVITLIQLNANNAWTNGIYCYGEGKMVGPASTQHQQQKPNKYKYNLVITIIFSSVPGLLKRCTLVQKQAHWMDTVHYFLIPVSVFWAQWNAQSETETQKKQWRKKNIKTAKENIMVLYAVSVSVKFQNLKIHTIKTK